LKEEASTMKVLGLVWPGVKTKNFEATTRLYHEVMGLDLYHRDACPSRFKLGSSANLHVYGPEDQDHDFFGEAR
jgi:hypothetical protein